MDCFWCRKKRKNNGNVNQSRNQKSDSNEGFFESQAAEFVPKMGMELDKKIVKKKRDNVNEPKTPDSNEGFFESQAANFVSEMGMELDKKIVEVTLNMEEFPGGEQIMKDANENRKETRKGIRVNRVDFGKYFHGFGLRKNDVIFLLNDRPIISEASVNMNLLRIINSSFNGKLYMKLFRAGAMSSVVNAEWPEPSVQYLIAESSVVNAESSVGNAESSVVNAESSVGNAESSVVNAESSTLIAESSVVNAERSTVDETVTLDNEGIDLCKIPNAEDIYVLVNTLQCRIQSAHYREEYLIIENGSIVLNPSADDATFTIRIYTEPCSSKNPSIVTLQHNASANATGGGGYIFKDGPNTLSTSSTHPHNTSLPSHPGVTTINRDSSYLFNVVIFLCTSCNSASNTVYQFQPLSQPPNSTTAIGFEAINRHASLMPSTLRETHFWL